MDDRTFDEMTKAVTGTWESRRAVFGRLGLGALAAVGIGAATTFEEFEEADAKNRKTRKKAICQCTTNTVASCVNRKAKKKSRKKIFKANPCSYKGKCNGTNPCSACTTAATCPGGLGCVNGVCATCTNGNQCATGQGCNGGVCGACTALNQCANGLICAVNGTCVVPPANGTGSLLPGNACTGGVGGTCADGLICVAGICAETCSLADPCTGAVGVALCSAGICVRA